MRYDEKRSAPEKKLKMADGCCSTRIRYETHDDSTIHHNTWDYVPSQSGLQNLQNSQVLFTWNMKKNCLVQRFLYSNARFNKPTNKLNT